ncbi:MAG TPA: multidrug efflux SMR transporter [Methylomusa anaerophila]|uniref:Quaternary ammonium compound-resistance protein QacC n=1 Tax=Methylomusa anaerophila TaxID=1930071 RepID=A0A348AQJ8_9FIRM|nr:multidrug efflux SMR transporter [Methylomusa anaerophila]BBB93346.1 quaternary ammonium compound-resistance protein QacC [Methylomusa anaerophila]HML86824.1 multidrug efflux SMR transporter [Methylomusa anaerophila]
MNGYVLLGIAIALEVFSTSMLKASTGFTKLVPSLAFIVGMGTSFYAISQAMTVISLNIAYAIWSGLGTVLTALVAILIWKESFNIYTGIGIALIIGGVVLLNLKGPGH